MNSSQRPTIAKLLKNSGIDVLDAEILLAQILGQTREHVIAHPEKNVRPAQSKEFFRLAEKRKNGQPLAYLTGHKEFYGLDFFVNKHVLVPRPETELMVELVNEQLTTNNEQIVLIDVGTGTGCIPISILSEFKNQNAKLVPNAVEGCKNANQNLKFPDVWAFATDISKSALHIAKKNARKHKVKINFLHGSLLEPIIKFFKKPNTYSLTPKTWLITANVPYLTQEQFDSEPSIQHEPKSALVAGNGGLALYEELLKQIQQITRLLLACHEDALSGCAAPYHAKELRSHVAMKIPLARLFVEIDPSQSSKIISLIKKYLPKARTEIKKDLSGQYRVVKIEIQM